MLYDRYQDENEFRESFVRPLLVRLGFLTIAELHGSSEFGKDFIFSEMTPFGFLRHSAAVVKHTRKIGQQSQTKLVDILSQSKQAFSVKFRLPDCSTEQRISSVFIINSGSISPNAIVWLRSEFDRERYGDNVHILDSERLSQLELNHNFVRSAELIPKLNGLKVDLALTTLSYCELYSGLPTIRDVRGSFTKAAEQYLSSPIMPGIISIEDISQYLQHCRIIDRLVDLILVKNLSRPPDNLASSIEKAFGFAYKLRDQIEHAFNSLGASQCDKDKLDAGMAVLFEVFGDGQNVDAFCQHLASLPLFKEYERRDVNRVRVMMKNISDYIEIGNFAKTMNLNYSRLLPTSVLDPIVAMDMPQ